MKIIDYTQLNSDNELINKHKGDHNGGGKN